MYAIIDIETNGGSLKSSKITEIAIFLHNGENVIDSFITLIDPETNIPEFITQLTGISNEMVVGAPKFYEVAKKIIEITQDAIFVAHSVNFDYTIIRNEFRKLGFDFKRDKLCTVKLSRKLIPLQPTYSLGKLCDSLGIEINGRHRAGGDAEATVELFEMLIALDNKKLTAGNIKPGEPKFENPNISAEQINTLPQEAGVYYFFNSERELIYVGKSKNIRKRIMTHMLNSQTKKGLAMRKEIADIDFEITGSELVALLKESDEIKQKKPFFNSAQKRTYFQYGLFTDQQLDGFIRLELRKIKEGSLPLTAYGSRKEGIEHLYKLNEEFNLCLTLTGLNQSIGACFHYTIKQCSGACIGKEIAEEYNARVMQALSTFRFTIQNVFVVDKGRSLNERTIIQVKNGRYVGFGFVPMQTIYGGVEMMNDAIDAYANNRDVQHILNTFMNKGLYERLIEY
jgi:DNA polymerase III subunit epsilon